jgi:hypothetical protein
MRRSVVILMTGTIAATLMIAQPGPGSDVAQGLADENRREGTIRSIMVVKSQILPLLLRWTTAPPGDVDETSLRIGLCDAFGELRANEAIPFLVTSIGLSRRNRVDRWVKLPQAVLEDLPAVAALVRIGPDSVSPIIDATRGSMTFHERLAAIFALSQIKGPLASQFLVVARNQAALEGYWADQGVKSNSK